MASNTELHIQSLIESSDGGEVLSAVLAYLRPFSDLRKCREEELTKAVESVTKQFVPFLIKSVSSLNKRLSVQVTHESPKDLFRAYDFCLECCELISFEPQNVQLKRVGLINCYLRWGWFTHAYNDAFRVLGQLKGPNSSSTLDLPNPEFGQKRIVLMLVAAIVRSVALSPDMEYSQYLRVSVLVREIKPWLAYLDANVRDKYLTPLLSDMGDCALSLIREAGDNTPLSFCISTLMEYSHSPLPKHLFYKFSRQVLSLLFVSKERHTIEFITSVLQTMPTQVPSEENWLELVDLVSFCAHKSQLAGKEWCARVSKQLSEIAAPYSEAIPQAYFIIMLYSTGLSVNVFDVEFRFREEGEETTGLQALLGDKDIHNSLVSLLYMIRQYSDNNNSQGQTYDKMRHALLYQDAFKFLCQPLASLINFYNKKVLLETQIACHLSDIILQFFHDALRFLPRWMPDKERSGTYFEKILPNVAMAAFFISMRTQLKLEITYHLVEDVIASPWITPPGLKYLFSSFHDIGVALYNFQHLEMASMVFKVCIRTVWTCIIFLCQIYVYESNSLEDHLSGKAITDFVSEACIKSAFYLDVLHQHGASDIEMLLVFILENWSAAEVLMKRLPDPTPVINHWLKTQRLRRESQDLAGPCTPLYSLLSSSHKISKILEQLELWRAKHTKIADIHLKDVFSTKDLSLERARILIWKAIIKRASGTEHLKECIDYLSQAIFISDNIIIEPTKNGTLCCHQLAVAYCLRALCIQETEPDSKQVFQDVNTSINLWLRIRTPCDSEESIPLENMMPLLCNVIDLLTIKGWIKLHQQIYELMFRLLRWKKVELEVCLAMLWDSGRLSHALCHCPINDAVFLSLSDYFGEKSESTAFWISCLQFSRAKSVGFQLSLQRSLYATLHTLNKHDTTIDDVISTASEIVSRDPYPSHSSFVAASLYYDLCKRQLSCGNLYEALSYAEEALRIRCNFFEDMFSYVAEMHFEEHNSAGKIIKIPIRTISKFEVKATDVWPCGKFLWDYNGCYLSPWNVLRRYLESILQVGVVNELIGEGAEAERLLTLGKSISSVKNLPPFILAFSLALGNLYTRMLSLDLAAKELQNAKELLTHDSHCCRSCRLLIEVTLYKQLGDLSQRQNGLSHAESLFNSALRKLCCSAWKGQVPEVNYCADPGIKKKQTDNRDSKKRRRGGAINLQAKEHNLTSEPSMRLTRSMSRSRQNYSADTHIGIPKKRALSDESDIFDEKGDTKNTIHGICICTNRKCAQGLSNTVTRSGLLKSLVSLKWQFHQRSLACSVLHSLGKCLAKSGKVHQAHEAIWQSMVVLFNRNVSSLGSASLSVLLDFIGREIKRDVFGVDRARILYTLCKLSLQTHHSRSICCDLSHIPLQKLVSLLKLAFVLSREVPILYQKISRLLAAIFLLSSSSAEFSFPCDGELSVSHWLAYYHQASLGAHFNYQFWSKFTRRYKSDKESSRFATAEFDFLRLAPENTEDFVKFAMNFFNSLSESTVICISMLGGTVSKLLQEMMKSPPVCAWLLVSRLNSKRQPVTVLVPIDSVLEEDDTGIKEMDERWACPWGSRVVDVVAPTFKSIFEDSFITDSELPVKDINLWLKKTVPIDLRLTKFLRKLEDSWLGPWRHLLLGESPDSKLLETTQKKLIKELRSKCKMEVNETLLKVFLQNGTNEFEGEAWISQLCLNPTSTSNDPQSRYAMALQLIREAEIKVKQQENEGKREPIILVLNHEIQMLPWESIPILRKQEVYRMPSVGSISAVRKKSCVTSPFPLIDPRDAYYLLNPSGDLKSPQIMFESWFKENKMEGQAGLVPAAKELIAALEKHDLFLYFGHGDGSQYIPMSQVNNLDRCAATFLMGCSSGSPYRRGRYVPTSVPISFLLAGSPLVVANLWGVKNDINHFTKSMMESWLSADDTSEKVGSFIADARNACASKYMTGAAPVCYGVPTAIINKKKRT